MANIRSILRQKGHSLLSVSPAATVLDAAHQMNEHRIGALLVVQDEHLLGILTERDVLTRVVAEDRAPGTVSVREVMTRDVITATPETDLETARLLFKNHRVRHLPILEDETLVGVVSIGDLNAFDLADSQVVITALKSYLYGVA